MERKIGEIFEYKGEWYQCIHSSDCPKCDLKIIKDCRLKFPCESLQREDCEEVIFKKLEKIGEPYEYFVQGNGIIMVQEYILYNLKYARDAIHNLYIFDCQNGRVAIEIKQ